MKLLKNSRKNILSVKVGVHHSNVHKNVWAAAVVVKLSACSPSTPTIWVWILLKSTTFIVQMLLEKNANKQTRGPEWPIFKKERKKSYFKVVDVNSLIGQESNKEPRQRLKYFLSIKSNMIYNKIISTGYRLV